MPTSTHSKNAKTVSAKGLRTYARMLGYIRPYVHLFALTAVASLLIVAVDALSVWITGSVIGSLLNSNAPPVAKPEFSISNINSILKYLTYLAIGSKSKLRALQIACIIIIASVGAKNLLLYIKYLTVSFLNLNIIKDLRNQLYKHVLALPVSYFDRNKSGKVVSLIVNDISLINASLTASVNDLLVDPIRVIVFWGLLFAINAKLTLFIFIVYPIMGYVSALIGKTVRRRTGRYLENFSGLLSVLDETIGNIRAVKMFNMNNAEAEKFSKENNRFVASFLRSARVRHISSPLTETLGYMMGVTLIWFAGKDVLEGQGFSGADFFHYILILFSSYMPLKRLSKVNVSLQSGIAASQRVFNLLDATPEALEDPDPEKIPTFESEISYNHVKFTYPESSELILNDISFDMPKGTIVAVVGSSGSGKSTLLDLLPRFYDTTEGSITIDGKDIREYDLVGLRSLFGIVSQETILFNDTIRNNIAYGAGDTNEKSIGNAAKAANALEFINSFPKGMDTVIGEKGVTLSGGQRQRLAIARALLRNPPVLILDEATSSLDTESERLVQHAINILMENRTVLVVAHRLSTILHADNIIVLENGKIVEQGTHRELLAMGGRYKYLYDIQFATPDNSSHTSAHESN